MPDLEQLFDLLSPPSCAACDTDLERSAVFCQPCREALVESRTTNIRGVTVIAAGSYGGPLATAIHRFKFEGRPDLGRQLGELLRRVARDLRLRADVVIPVPLHRARLAERGYNQSALLARRVASTLGARFDANLLSRTRQTRPQFELGRDEREQNVRGAFTVARRGRPLGGLRVMLIDDVVTTGATSASCAEALTVAGVASAQVLCLARAERAIEGYAELA